MHQFNKKLALILLFGVFVLGVTAFAADFRETVDALKEFNYLYMPVVLGFTFINYLLRFLKWQFYLRQADIELNIKDSLVIFFSGLAMSVTPGKAGELLKALLVKEIKGTPVRVTAPVILAERLSDGIGLVILSFSGLLLFDYGAGVLAGLIAGAALIIIVFRYPLFHKPVLAIIAKLPVIGRFTNIFEALTLNTRKLLTFKALVFTVAISVVSWFFECLAFYFVFKGLNYHIPVLAAVFTLSFSSVVGAVSMLPGGLGAAEGSIMGLLVTVIGVPKVISAISTILIRLCTLWFGVIIGFAALLLNRRLLRCLLKAKSAADVKGTA